MNSTLASNQYNLQNEVNSVSLYIYPIIVFLTVTTNILNICVLCRRNFRASSCAHYFLALAIISILYTCEVPVMMFIRLRFGIAVTSSSVGCRLQTFLIFVLPLCVSIILVLASVDRFFASSSSVGMRNLSQVHIAPRIIITTVILIILYAIPFLFIYYFDSNINQCVTYSSAIAIIYLSSRIVLFYIMIPLAIGIFGFLTIRNIQSQLRTIAPIIINSQAENRYRRRERQLARMLILHISAYFVFSLPAGVAYTLVTFVTSMNTTFMVQLRIIFTLWQQNLYFLPLLLYILSSKTYRQEFKRMLKFNNC
jgi:hypothetical protein